MCRASWAGIVAFWCGWVVLVTCQATSSTLDVSESTQPVRLSYTTLWDAVVQASQFSTLTRCIQLADPSILQALNQSNAAQPHTLFAPSDSAFATSAAAHSTACLKKEKVTATRGDPKVQPDESNSCSSQQYMSSMCADSATATSLLRYWISTTTGSVPYIGQAFTSIDDNADAIYFYGIAKTPDVPKSFFPIQFANNANITAGPLLVGSADYLITVDKVLQPPAGTIWQVLCSDPSFSSLAASINQTTSLRQKLDTADGATFYTLFAPDDAAMATDRATMTGERGALGDDPSLLEVQWSFHTLGAGVYPGSLNGQYYSQQFFPTTAGDYQTRNYYRSFYAESFTGVQVASLAGPSLNVSRLAGGALLVEGVAVTQADIPATNGVVHRLAAPLKPPGTLAEVLAAPPAVLSAAGTFEAMTEVLQLAWPLVNTTLLGGPYTLLAPTDAAFQLAVDQVRLPPRPLADTMTPAAAAELVLHHLLDTDPPLLFAPTAQDAFASGFQDGASLPTMLSLTSWGGGLDPPSAVSLSVHWKELSLEGGGSAAREVFVNEARVYQCVGGSGMGQDCAQRPSPSNTYALNGAAMCIVHALDRVLMPPQTEEQRGSGKAANITAVLRSMPELSSCADLLLDSPGVPDWGPGPFTLMAPGNTAMAHLKEQRPWLFESRTALGELLRYHVIGGTAQYSRYLNSSQRLTTLALSGQAPVLANYTATSGLDSFRVNLASANLTDVTATDGVLHVVDSALVPDVMEIAQAWGFGGFVGALGAQGSEVADELRGQEPHTLLAVADEQLGGAAGGGPSVEALRYHVLKGLVDLHTAAASTEGLDTLHGQPVHVFNNGENVGNPFVGGVTGLYVDHAEVLTEAAGGLQALNGGVYQLASLLKAPSSSVYSVLLSHPNTTRWAALLAKGGLDGGLSSTDPSVGPFTVFAPSNAALELLWGEGNALAKLGKQLVPLLQYHIVQGRVYTGTMTNATEEQREVEQGDRFCSGAQLMTLQGQALGVQVAGAQEIFLSCGDAYSLFAARVLDSDLNAANGVVHVISAVLTYPGFHQPLPMR